MKRRVLVGALAALLAVPAAAETSFGVRGGYYAEAGEPFAGAEILLGLSERFTLAPNVEVLLVDGGRHVVGSVDLHYDLSCTCSTGTTVWAGAGAALVDRKPDGGEATLDVGLNLLAGVGVKLGGLTPYAQLRATLKNAPELSVGLGLRF